MPSHQNEQKTDIDACYIIVAPLTGTINGRLWMDGNNNKLREVLELPLIGVEVKLFKIDGTLISTQTSGIDGLYSFVDVPFGDYYVLAPSMNEKLFVLYSGQSVPFDSDISNAFWPGSTRIITVFPGDIVENIDLGYADKITIGDFVWDDINNNGLQDAGEPGLNTVKIQLINETGTIEKTVISNIDGFFIFDNIPVGRYSLVFEKLNDYVFTAINAANINLNSKANENGIVSLSDFLSPQSYVNIDAGYVKAGSIGDNVWLDLNGNGFFQQGEPGILGVQVKLFSSDGLLRDSTITSVQASSQFSGYYTFENVRPGMYFIKFEIPSNYILSPSNVGGVDNDSNITNANGPKTTDVFMVGINEFVSNIDAGAYLPATLGDRVWNDLNMNGAQDIGEPGIEGVTVSLFTQSGINLETKVTDINGNYAFTGLRQRLYYVQFTLLEGFMFSEQNIAGNGAIDSDVDQTGTTPLISLAHGSTFLDIDAGMHTTNANLVMGTIWNDLNKNGLRTEDETLMPMVQVFLKDESQNIISTSLTNHAGMYCFATEHLGQHFVIVELPVDHVFTSKGSGSNANKDSDVDSDGISDMILFGDNYVMKYIDAGLLQDKFRYQWCSMVGSRS
ncbi:MAG: hypothetical protein IPO92_09255 [Saprospiraceae bacterium]|nr:hypothetical protein [Saprospiraceae bacterium]